MTITGGQVLADALHFPKRWKPREHLGTRIQKIALFGVEAVLQVTNKKIVVLVEGVVHAERVMRAGKLRGRIPIEARYIQAIARPTADKTVGQRKALEKARCAGISADSRRIVTWRKYVVAVNTVVFCGRSAEGNAGQQVTACVNQLWRVLRYRSGGRLYCTTHESKDARTRH